MFDNFFDFVRVSELPSLSRVSYSTCDLRYARFASSHLFTVPKLGRNTAATARCFGQTSRRSRTKSRVCGARKGARRNTRCSAG